MSNAEQVLLETLIGIGVGSEKFRDALMRSAFQKLLASGAESSEQYIELLLALSEATGVDEIEIGVPEARASHRKLVAVITRMRNSKQESHRGN